MYDELGLSADRISKASGSKDPFCAQRPRGFDPAPNNYRENELCQTNDGK